MSVLTRLRRLHDEVCHCWRERQGPIISEGEAEIINIGFLLLEQLIHGLEQGWIVDATPNDGVSELLVKYGLRVQAQFDEDADIVIKGDSSNE